MPYPVDEKFLLAVHKLTAGLRHAYEQSGAKKPLRTLIEELTDQLKEGEAADIAEAFVDGKFIDTKELDLLRIAFASIFQAYSVEEARPGHGLPHLAQAYFFAGMAHAAHSAAAGSRKRAANFEPFEQFCLQAVKDSCPPEKWVSIAAMWRGIQAAAEEEHKRLKDTAGRVRKAEVAFRRLAKKERRYIETFLSRPVGPGNKPSAEPAPRLRKTTGK